MFSIIAIALLFYSRHLYRRGVRGLKVSLWHEKVIILFAAIACMVGIAELIEYISSFFTRDGDEFSSWLPALVGYPLGMILFIFIVLVVMPPPIPREKSDKPKE